MNFRIGMYHHCHHHSKIALRNGKIIEPILFGDRSSVINICNAYKNRITQYQNNNMRTRNQRPENSTHNTYSEIITERISE